MKCLILDCGGVLVYPPMGGWNVPFRIREILGPRAEDLHTPKYLQAHRQSAAWLDESRMVATVEEERLLRREYIRSLDALMDWHMTEAEITALADDFTDNYRRFGLFEDVTPGRERWKRRYRLGMLSDAMPSTLSFLRQYGIYDLFDATVLSCHVGAIKPDPRMYAAVLEALEARPEDCLFVDDRVCNLEGAVAVGMSAVQMARSAFLPDALWDGPVVRDFETLNKWIEA